MGRVQGEEQSREGWERALELAGSSPELHSRYPDSLESLQELGKRGEMIEEWKG